MRSILPRLWERIPVIARAVIVAFLVLTIGQLPPGIFLLLNLDLGPAIPWFLPATAVWLLVFWYYLDGHGRPASTATQRREDLRGVAIDGRTWAWSLLAGGLAMACVMTVALLTGRLADLPAAAFEAPFDVRSFPVWTIVAFFLNLALVAGVVEEAAFRGYLLSRIQRRHGWVIGIGAAAVLFYLAHLSHAYATLAFVPFFMLYSIVQGVLVFLTRSILPSVVLHVVSDFVMLPIQYGVVPSPLGSALVPHVIAIGAFAIAGVLAFLRLAAITASDRGESIAVVGS